MREIKIIPLVLSVAGLISCGFAVNSNELGLNEITAIVFAFFAFIFLLLLSVGVIGEKNKFTW